ncbi:phospholipase A and acyltransferase 1-like [Paramormyrops kingsleyae]|uniref:phospholipase A and acyltransferase 1-like n=1 Tax=Paramormyrops kingsleyae TaxID=1676925 RepID=UPI003B96B82B
MAQRMVVVQPKPGDLIEIPRGPIYHWAIYIGNGYVIHLTTPGRAGFSSMMSVSINRGIVKKERLLDVVGGSTYYINNLLDYEYKPRSVWIILSDAQSLVGQKLQYDVARYNSAHFVIDLRYGKPEFRQIGLTLKAGDLIEICRGRYDHWAIYVGDDYVIHITSDAAVKSANSMSSSLFGKAIVKLEKLLDVVGNDNFRVSNRLDIKYKPRSVSAILSDALSLVGQTLPYSLIQQNCEHFVTFLRYGKPESMQANLLRALILFGPLAIPAFLKFRMMRNRMRDEALQ